MRQPINILDDVKEGEFEEVWDKKKIFIFLVCIVALFFGGGIMLRSKFSGKIPFLPKISNGGVVEGTSTLDSALTPTPIPHIDLQTKMNELKTAVLGLSVSDISTSSPEVQKVLNQIKNLGDIPKTQAKQACERICQNF